MRKVFSFATGGFLSVPIALELRTSAHSSDGLTENDDEPRQGKNSSGDKPEKKVSRVPVGIARGKSVRESVQKAVELGGGLGFIKPGSTVLVKPNVNSDDSHPGTTNPEVLLHVLESVWGKNPKRVIVSDRSGFWGKTIEFMKKTGLYEAAIQGKAEVIPFDDGPWTEVKPASATSWKDGFRFPELPLRVDSIISIPVCKTHKFATFTMAIKNFVGFLHPDDRTSRLHKSHGEPGFGTLIAELGLAVTPKFYVMDATKVFVSGGPATGDEKKVDLIIASRDRVANDVVGLGLLKLLGTEKRIQDKSVWEQPQIKRTIELGLGIRSIEELKLQGFNSPEAERILRYLS
ncbi:MAG: DUF362 domain-containing protein [Candidatus Eisenbacteria bacterium]|nr:DUF362 domain-containing protein [Candidatus Eisenbacteria bacterium]